jgi:hypothetical protein
MRESHNLINAPAVRPTLEAVRHQFEAWRKRRRCRSRIPEDLWEAAADLCQEHSLCEVSRGLRLNYNDLKHHVQKSKDRGLAVGQDPDLGFVRLDLAGAIAAPQCLVEMEAPNGARMRMSFKGGARDFDPVQLGRAFWRQGR